MPPTDSSDRTPTGSIPTLIGGAKLTREPTPQPLLDGISPVRLAILDDHEVLLDSLTSWIGANAPDFEVVPSAKTWLELVHSANFPTQLVFLDFQLKEPVSIEARVRTCRAAGAKVIVLTSLDSKEARDRAIEAAAGGVLFKAKPPHEGMGVARARLGDPDHERPQT